MRRSFYVLGWSLGLALGLLAAGCTDPLGDDDLDGGGPGVELGVSNDAGSICKNPNGDEDGDGIQNGEEGCLSGRDSDGDGTPDWRDFDSDEDGVYDHIEKGTKTAGGKCQGAPAGKDSWPCDTDGDGVPDYLDQDSDGDSLKDGDEDANGDGLLGCCLTACNKPGDSWQKKNCTLTTDGCGPGQTCSTGKCYPAAAFKCSEGETNPKAKDTFGDGKLDNQRGTFICRDATEDKPAGRKSVLTRDNSTGDWNVAMDTSGTYGEVTISGATAKMAAAAIDHTKSTDEVAGFVISKESTTNIQTELTTILSALSSGVGGTISQRASGTQGKSHDRYDTIKGTILDVTLSSSSDVSSVRNKVIAAMLGKSASALTNLPSSFGTSDTKIVITFTTVKRFDFKKDAYKKEVLDSKGYPIDSGDKTKWRLLVVGAVVTYTSNADPKKNTGILADDLSNGTALATFLDTVINECDVGTITKLPVADIIWVVDESGSMDDKRQDVTNNANNFFSRALSAGLDFRMGVTGVCNPSDTSSYTNCSKVTGKFCSQVSTDSCDTGGTDRFLEPSEQTIFSSCIYNPPGCEGGSEYGLVNAKASVTGHLPRTTKDSYKIRTGASLVLIIATDEIPQSLSSVIGYGNLNTCTLDATTQAKVDVAIQPYLDLFTGVTDSEAAAKVHLIGGTCQSTGCSTSWTPDVAHGYKELAQKLGGQWADVCQKNLGSTLQVIIDDITGQASPVKLDYVPISASLAVALDATVLTRSRTNGFDFRSANRSLVFINVKYSKGSEVIASYKRWLKQVPPG